MVPAKHRSAQGAPGVAYVFHDICVLEDFHVRRGSYCKLRGCQTVDTTECFSREDRPSPAVLLMIIRPDPISVAGGERTLLVMMHVRNTNRRSALSDAPEVK